MAHPAVTSGPVGGAAYVIHADGAGLSRRGRTLAWALAFALLFVGAGALYAAAAPQLTGVQVPQSGTADGRRAAAGLGGAPVGGGQYAFEVAEVGLDDVITAQWDGPTTHLDWKGDGYSTAGATFTGERVATPGDEVQRTLNIGNAGPSQGVLTIGLLLDQQVPAVAENPDLAQGIEVFWDVAGVKGSQSFAELLAAQADGTPVVAQVRVPQSATAPVTVGFRMDAEVTGHNALGADSTQLSFEVLAHMQGDTTADQPPALLPQTGAAILGGLALALGLLVVGMLLLAAVRRRRCDNCGERIRDGEWSEYHRRFRRRRILCAKCSPHPVANAEQGISAW